MGIEISIKSDKPIFKKIKTQQKNFEVFNSIKNKLYKLTSKIFPEQFINITLDEQRFSLLFKLHPASNGLIFSISNDGYLVAEEKTSPVGPGYHSFIVKILTMLSNEIKITWNWNESSDSTKYFHNKNFTQLQEEWVKLLSLQAVTAEQVGKARSVVRIDLPLEYIGPRNLTDLGYCAISPTGYWKIDWFTQFIKANPEDKIQMARKFYPWWNEGLDDFFWKNYGISMIQLEIPWHILEHNEINKYNLTLQAFDLAKKINPKLKIPEKEIEEVQKLLEMNNSQKYTPDAEGLGLLKYNIMKRVFPSWSIEIPGYFYEHWDYKNNRVQLLHENRCITASSVVLQIPENKKMTPEELLPPPSMYEQAGAILHSKISKPNISGYIFENKMFLDMGQFIIQCILIGKSRICNLTFTIDEDDKEWALKVIDSVKLEG